MTEARKLADPDYTSDVEEEAKDAPVKSIQKATTEVSTKATKKKERKSRWKKKSKKAKLEARTTQIIKSRELNK